MNRRQIGLKLVLEELGVSASMDTFDSRLKLQKAIYLAQSAGIPLNYRYSWYLRGPYSSELTADAFAARDESPAGWDIGEPLRKRLAELKPFFDGINRSVDAVRSYEILASVLFIINTRKLAPADVDGITSIINNAGKEVARDEIVQAIEQLTRANLLSHGTENRR